MLKYNVRINYTRTIGYTDTQNCASSLRLMLFFAALARFVFILCRYIIFGKLFNCSKQLRLALFQLYDSV